MDPLSLIALGAAVGGGTGKFVEKAWDSGEKWIASFFRDHSEKANTQAKSNSLDFLKELAIRVKELEEAKIASNDEISQAQDHPDFSVFLQKALLTSAQTDNKDTHKLLARLVAERLTADPESTFSLASKMACDTLAYTSPVQIKLLGLAMNLLSIVPSTIPEGLNDAASFKTFMDRWITNRLKPFEKFDFSNFDLQHIEALSLVITYTGIRIAGNDGTGRLNERLSTDRFQYQFNDIDDNELKVAVLNFLGPVRLDRMYLTTTGQIIGAMVSDQITGMKTSFEGFK